MTEHDQPSDDRSELSRRALIGGAAALGGAGLISLAGASSVSAAPALPEALAAPLPGLTYIGLDAFAFDVTGGLGAHRLYQDETGVQPQNPAPPPTRLMVAPLPIPIGSVVRQINIAYQTQPSVGIIRRELGSGTPTAIVPTTPLAAGSGPSTQTLAVDATLTQGATYYVQVNCHNAADSIMGVTIGYVPPTQAFVPFSGAAPRVLDTREPGQGGAFGAGQERVIDLSSKLVPGARSAIINITATGTQGAGWFAVFRDGISHPGNSSLNWFGPGQIVANNVVTAVTAGKIKVLCGPAGSHCVIDVVGSLI